MSDGWFLSPNIHLHATLDRGEEVAFVVETYKKSGLDDLQNSDLQQKNSHTRVRLKDFFVTSFVNFDHLIEV